MAEQHKRKYILDTSLRDGEQAPGFVFSYKEKRKLAELLCDSGIDEIEAGIPVSSRKEQEFIYSLRDLGVAVSSWCRATKKDIEAAAGCNTGRIHISLPVSDILLAAMKKTRQWVLDNIEAMFKEAARDFDFISLGAMDATRADRDFVIGFVKQAADTGFDRIRISDTVGISNPAKIADLISQCSSFDIAVDFHGHDDLGMATANSFTALQSGASWVNGTLLGIGERAGNAPLEEIAAAIMLDNEMECGLDIRNLQKAAKYIAKISREKISPRKAVIGRNVFTHESGIHYALQLRDPVSFQPCRPEAFGRSGSLYVMGKHSGSNAVKDFCRNRGFDLSVKDLEILTGAIRSLAEKKKRLLKQWEVLKLVRKHIDKGASNI